MVKVVSNVKSARHGALPLRDKGNSRRQQVELHVRFGGLE